MLQFENSVLVSFILATLSLLSRSFAYQQRLVFYPQPYNNCRNPCSPIRGYRWQYRQRPMPMFRPLVPAIINPRSTTPTYLKPPSIITTNSTSTPLLRPGRNLTSPDGWIFAPNQTITKGYPTRRDRHVNPCIRGKPMSNEYDTPISCNYMVKPNGGCPDDFWCHTGSSYTATTCCPVTERVSKCEQQRSPGEGDDLIARWYFDTVSKQCRRFLYRGMLGNENNFMSKAQCFEVCATVHIAETSNPCRQGRPAKTVDNARIICGINDVHTCPNNHYCHFGDTPENTACCERSPQTDPCQMAINVGQGKAMIKRFYYNTVTRRCTEFVYRGTRGNENNWLSYKDCEDACIKWENPCPTLFEHAERKECSMDLPNACSPGEWCHNGANKLTTICCPEASPDPCMQPLIEGVGNANLTRWYADPMDRSCQRQCKSFVYHGTKGNQNNFLSKAACEKICEPKCDNPCSTGSLLLDIAGMARQCSPSDPCPNSHWCHVGGNINSTVCCSAVANPCELSLLLGQGDYRLTRWHYEKRERRCISFIYRGTGGNQNMFLTMDDCKTICPAYENPCSTGPPLLIDGGPKVCSPNERCPNTHFCHIGPKEAHLNFCCPKNGDPCRLPLLEGKGDHSLMRFYYDWETRRCREFVYKGTKGNANNFLSMDDCETVCPVYPNPCLQGDPLLNERREPVICGGADTCPSGFWCHVGGSPETTNCCPGTRLPCDSELLVGTGNEQLERWYFDGSSQLCRPFMYHGMKGNANSFLTKQQCRSTCPEVNPCAPAEPLTDGRGERILCTGGQMVNSCPRSHYCHVGTSTATTLCCPKHELEPCDQPKTEGGGTDELPRWFFDKAINRCVMFSYSGVGGNENNFIAKHTCEERCPPHHKFCPHGQPLLMVDEHSTPLTCGIDHACQNGYICHMNSERNVSVCCQDPTNFCMQPRDHGPCDHDELRYGYDPASDTCVEFQYGGCQGNENNFRSLRTCTEICCKEYRMMMHKMM